MVFRLAKYCSHCGKKAGFFGKVHPECVEEYQKGRREMVARAANAALGRSSYKPLKEELRLIAERTFVPLHDIRGILLQGWNTAVDNLLSERVPTGEEEDALLGYLMHFSLKDDKELSSAWRLVESIALREVLAGRLPVQPNLGPLPFNFQANELIVWTFPGVDYYERRTKRIRQGISHGVSKRIMNGLYYSPRVFRSETIEAEETKLVDSGIVALTDKHIYFGGQEKAFRIPYRKVVSFDGHAWGFSLVRDAATARPQMFATGDGWFSYNLVTNLARRGS